MNMPAEISIDFITTLLGFLFTLLVLSYLLGDNPLFRVALSVFVGVAAGYAASIAWHQVLRPKLFAPFLNGTAGERILLIMPLLMALLLLTKISPRTAQLGSPAMAFLVGVGAAVAVGGAVVGTLFPQIEASINLFDLSETGSSPPERLVEGSVILLGTLTTLVYFHFGAKPGPRGPQRSRLVNLLAWIGQIFVAITFGVIFAGVYAAAMTAFIERLNFLWDFIRSFL